MRLILVFLAAFWPLGASAAEEETSTPRIMVEGEVGDYLPVAIVFDGPADWGRLDGYDFSMSTVECTAANGPSPRLVLFHDAAQEMFATNPGWQRPVPSAALHFGRRNSFWFFKTSRYQLGTILAGKCTASTTDGETIEVEYHLKVADVVSREAAE